MWHRPFLVSLSLSACIVYRARYAEALPLWAASVTVLLGAMALAKRFNCIDEPVDEDSAPRAPSFRSAGALDIDELEPALMSVLDERGLTARERAALLATWHSASHPRRSRSSWVSRPPLSARISNAYRKLGVASFKVFREETYATQLEKKLSAVDERNSCTADSLRSKWRRGDMLAYALRLLVAVNVARELLLVFSDTAGVFSAVFKRALYGALVGVVALTLIKRRFVLLARWGRIRACWSCCAAGAFGELWLCCHDQSFLRCRSGFRPWWCRGLQRGVVVPAVYRFYGWMLVITSMLRYTHFSRIMRGCWRLPTSSKSGNHPSSLIRLMGPYCLMPCISISTYNAACRQMSMC